jgi:hypothetical protein
MTCKFRTDFMLSVTGRHVKNGLFVELSERLLSFACGSLKDFLLVTSILFSLLSITA